MTDISKDMLINMLHPGIIMIAFGVITMLLPRPCRRHLSVIAPACAFLAFMQMGENSSLVYKLTPYIRIQFIHFDSIAYAFMLVFCVIALLNGIYGEGIQHRYECGMSMIYAGSVMGVVLAGDLLSLIIFWEISAFASTYVIYAKHDMESERASFRYLLVHAFGGNMLLAGVIVYIFHYGNEITNITEHFGEPFFWLIAACVLGYLVRSGLQFIVAYS